MGGQEVDIGRRKGEPRVAGTGRYKGEKVNIEEIKGKLDFKLQFLLILIIKHDSKAILTLNNYVEIVNL